MQKEWLLQVAVSAPRAFSFFTETLHMMPCLPSEVSAALFHLPFVAELTAGNSNKENCELLLTGKKEIYFKRQEKQYK